MFINLGEKMGKIMRYLFIIIVIAIVGFAIYKGIEAQKTEKKEELKDMNIDFLLIPEEQRYRMDIHSYTLEEAIITIQNTLDILEYGIRVIVVIHGYSTGSILLKGIRNDLKHNRIEKIVPSLNPGVTLIYLKENYTIPLRKIKRKKYKKKKKKRKL